MLYLRALADRLDAVAGVVHVPVHDAIAPSDPSFHDRDRVHPKVNGSAVMAGLRAYAIFAAR